YLDPWSAGSLFRLYRPEQGTRQARKDRGQDLIDSKMSRIIPFNKLSAADLIVDAVYESSADGQLSGEPIARLLPGSGNMGGFRVSGRGERKNWVVLFSTGEDRDWPDSLDLNTGKFVYYGDNK